MAKKKIEHVFKRGKKPLPPNPRQNIEQSMAEIEEAVLEQGGPIISISEGKVKKISINDWHLQNEARRWEKIGDAHFEANEYQLAIDAFKKALEVFPDEVLYMNIGVSYASLWQFDKGISYLKQSIEFNPNYDRAKRNLAAVMAMKAQYMERISQ